MKILSKITKIFCLSFLSVFLSISLVQAAACGSANGTATTSAPTANLCSSGTSSTVLASGNNWIWTCGGTVNCSATDPNGPYKAQFNATEMPTYTGNPYSPDYVEVWVQYDCSRGFPPDVAIFNNYKNAEGCWPINGHGGCASCVVSRYRLTKKVAINGVCGSTHYSCNAGTSAGGSPIYYDNKWIWTCSGIDGGSSVSCSENFPACTYNYSGWSACDGSAEYFNADANNVPCNGTQSWTAVRKCSIGVCGSANGGNSLTVPTTNLCTTGTASGVAGSGPWTWSCLGTSNGASASCTSTRITNGVCGSANGAGFLTVPTSNLCADGTATAVSGTGPWAWSCTGANTGTTASCSATKMTNGSCGSANGKTYAYSETGYGSDTQCLIGSSSNTAFPSQGSSASWTCSGTNGGSVANCSASRSNVPVNGSCGSSNSANLSSIPVANLCTAGTATAVSGTGPWAWSCTGLYGGTASSCSANLIVNGSCGSSNSANLSSIPVANLCTAGTATAVSGTGPWAWSCTGANTGTTASCSANLIVNGLCGSSNGGSFLSAPTNNLCTYGNPISGSGLKRKAITISNGTGSTITNSSIGINVAYDSDMQADFDDLRFTLSDNGTQLTYWVESKTDSSTAKVWVKIPTILTTGTTIYMHYGDASAVSLSDPASYGAVVFSDDFTGNNISNWTQAISGTSGDVIADTNRMRIRSYMCSNVSATKSLGNISGQLDLSFIWSRTNVQWGEYSDWAITVNGVPVNTQTTGGLGYNAPGSSSGTISNYQASVNGTVALVYRIYQTAYCGERAGGTSYVWIDNVVARLASVANTTNTIGVEEVDAPIFGISGPWVWDCVGLNGGTTASCSASQIVEGVCGTANGKEYDYDITSYGSDTQCAGGTSSSASFPAQGSTANWNCVGASGGATVSCSASRAVAPTNGTCGSSNSANLSSIPVANLCTAGTATAVSGTGPWSWSCTGINGGTNATCSANLIINGVCGSSHGQVLPSIPVANLCTAGTATAVSGTGPWSWSCTGLNSGTAASCSASNGTNAICGPSENGIYSVAPTTGLCTSGVPTSASWNGYNWAWVCQSGDGGRSDFCYASRSGTPVCGTSHGSTFDTIPATNLCVIGTASTVTGTGPWFWTCNNVSGTPLTSCSANKTGQVCPFCGN